MPAPLSGPGLGLQIPQNLYPSELTNAPYDYGTNQVALPGGTQIPIPAGDWYISLGQYLLLEFLDPVIGVWVMVASGTNTFGPLFVKSDGFNYRIANRLGCPVGGVVLTGGSSYVQATTTVAVTGGGGSTWLPVVGGAYAVSSIISTGAGYGVPPLVLIPAPPPGSSNPNGVGGKPASAYAVIGSNGSVVTVSMSDQGCGYPSGVTVVLLPNPTDPNISSGITLSTIAFSTTFAGSITGVLNTNPGNAIATPQQLSLAVSGAGTNASVAPVMLETTTAVSVSVGGAGFGLAGFVDASMGGGAYPLGSLTLTREFNNIFARPRPGLIRLTVSGANGSIAAQSGQIVDGGLLFVAGNNAVIGGLPSINIGLGASAGTAGSIVGPAFVNTFGGSNVFDVAIMQPAP